MEEGQDLKSRSFCYGFYVVDVAGFEPDRGAIGKALG